MSWSKEFDEPISIGRTLLTHHDAASYITALSEKEADASEWQAAIDDTGSRVRKPDDVCSDRHHEGIEPPPCSRVQYVTERTSLGAREADKRSAMTVLIL